MKSLFYDDFICYDEFICFMTVSCSYTEFTNCTCFIMRKTAFYNTRRGLLRRKRQRLRNAATDIIRHSPHCHVHRCLSHADPSIIKKGANHTFVTVASTPSCPCPYPCNTSSASA